jgi:hypothetical protein
VIAERTGKDEAQVLREEASSYDIHLRLTSEQFAEKRARQMEIDEMKTALAVGGGDKDPESLKVRCAAIYWCMSTAC